MGRLPYENERLEVRREIELSFDSQKRERREAKLDYVA